MNSVYSYTAFAAQERAERSAGAPGLSLSAKVDAMFAVTVDELHTRATRQRIGNDARNRRDAREQFRARLAEIA